MDFALNGFYTLKHPPVIEKHLKMASPFIENKRVRVIATTRNDASFSLDQRDANPYRIFRMLIAVVQPSSHI